MLAAVAAAAILVAASLVLGQALLSLGGRRESSPLAGGVGLAGLLVVGGLGAKLPGGGEAVAVLAGLIVLGAAAWLVARGLVGREARGEAADPGWLGELFPHSGNKSTIAGVGAAVIAGLAAAIPFLVNDRVGVLGAGLVNDDMANHLLMADWVGNETEPRPELIDDGYPLGPHSVAATIGDLLGTGLVEAFAGLTLAIAALAAITALAALRDLPPGRRTVAAALVALPYLGAAYLVQGAFKEPLQGLLLVAFALALVPCVEKVSDGGTNSTPDRRWVAVPAGVIAAAAIYNYSFPGLFWLAGTAALWWLLTSGLSLRALAASARAALPALAATAGVTALLTLPDWGRVVEFAGFGAFDPAGEQTGLGNLRQAINPLEALGVWPTGEFRLSPADAALPAAIFYLAGMFAAVALAIGLVRAIRRRADEPVGLVLVAALGSAAAIYLGAAVWGTPYTSAKALAIAAPVAMLVALRGLLAPDPLGSSLGRRWRSRLGRFASPAGAALALAFVAAAAVSSFLVLRQAPVAPGDHADELAEIRPLVQGDPVLFLGRDDFIAWHLRGSPVSTHIQNFFSTESVPARVDPPDGEKFDFDAVSAKTLNRFEWVLTTSSGYGSQTNGFRPAEETRSYVLWKRAAGAIPRKILDEGTAPGAVLECSQRPRLGATAIWRPLPAEGSEADWQPSATIAPGQPATQTLELESGLWQISLAYDSPRALELAISGRGLPERRLELPANLDFRGPTPPFPASPVLDLHHRGTFKIDVALSEAPLAGRVLGAEGEAHLRGVFAVRFNSIERGAAREACGEYVDWYLPERVQRDQTP